MRKKSGTTQITVRVPSEWLPRAEELAKKLSQPGIPANRVDAFRACIATGFETLEAAKAKR